MIDEIKMAFQDFSIPIIAIIALVVGLILGKGKRKQFLIPSIIITATIINPLFYNFWYKFNSRAYWRTLWVIPVIVLCAFTPAMLVEKLKKSISKAVVIASGVMVFILFGGFVYRGNTFVEARNADKLPESVVSVASALLEYDKEPYVVTDASLSRYLRQYSGRIKTLYGRDVDWGLNSPQAEKVYRNLSNDLETVVQTMLDYDYEYLVTSNTDIGRRNALEQAGAELIKQIDEYGIYRVSGRKTQLREYNSLHQIRSITYVDDNGIPSNNEQGYAKIVYEYNKENQIVLIDYLDLNNNLVDNRDGFARIKYEYPEGFINPIDYYYNADGCLLERGRGYLHAFLQSVNLADSIVFISVYDEASSQLSNTLVDDMKKLGLRINLKEKYGYSYYAIVSSTYLQEESSKEPLSYEGAVDEIHFKIESCGGNSRTGSSIIINGMEYSPNKRGLNIVIYDNRERKVTDSIAFDTYDCNILTYRAE